MCCFVHSLQLVVVWAGLWGGKTLHDDMIFSLFRAPMSFFNATPIGRIINRVTRDVSGVDKACTVTFTPILSVRTV